MSRTNGSRPDRGPLDVLTQEGFQGVPDTPAGAVQRRADALAGLAAAMNDGTPSTPESWGPAKTAELPDWAQEVEDWWVNTAHHDIADSIGKIVAYGGSGAAYDLIATGHDLAAMNGRTVQDQEATELGILFYLSSKVNRWMAAAIDGRAPSDDTLLDIVYYGMMARRNRAVGGWPVKPA